jgi:hypothetical protein
MGGIATFYSVMYIFKEFELGRPLEKYTLTGSTKHGMVKEGYT